MPSYHRILITGGSGYLGGSLLAALTKKEPTPSSDLVWEKLFALVRSDAQAESVRNNYPGAQPLRFDAYDAGAVRDAIVTNRISVVFFLIDSTYATAQKNFISALSTVREATGLDVHFVHTSGAKIFSSHAGAPVDRPLYDDEDCLYEIQKTQKAQTPRMGIATATNNTVIEAGEANNVKTYIFIPCIVYGKSEGYGHSISIQTVDIVCAAKAARRVYRLDDGSPSWPVCHISDNTSLYVRLLEAIVASAAGGSPPPNGHHGYYLASSGSVVWNELYTAMGEAMAKRGVIGTLPENPLPKADDHALGEMAKGCGCPKEAIHLRFGGKCTLTARTGFAINWKPRYKPEHIIETAEEEVELILNSLE